MHVHEWIIIGAQRNYSIEIILVSLIVPINDRWILNISFRDQKDCKKKQKDTGTHLLRTNDDNVLDSQTNTDDVPTSLFHEKQEFVRWTRTLSATIPLTTWTHPRYFHLFSSTRNRKKLVCQTPPHSWTSRTPRTTLFGNSQVETSHGTTSTLRVAKTII